MRAIRFAKSRVISTHHDSIWAKPRNNCFSFNFNASARKIAFNKAHWCLLHFFQRRATPLRSLVVAENLWRLSVNLFLFAAKVQQVECCDFSARPRGVENHIFATPRNMQIAFEIVCLSAFQKNILCSVINFNVKATVTTKGEERKNVTAKTISAFKANNMERKLAIQISNFTRQLAQHYDDSTKDNTMASDVNLWVNKISYFWVDEVSFSCLSSAQRVGLSIM